MFPFELNLDAKEEDFHVKRGDILGREKVKEKVPFCLRNGAFSGTGFGEGMMELRLKG